MSGKKKIIFSFIVLPILLVAVVLATMLSERKNRTEQQNDTSTLSREEEIDRMLLEEYQKSQATREYAEFSTEAPQLTPDDLEYDDMIDNSVFGVRVGDDKNGNSGDSGDSADDRIAAAEENGWASNSRVVSSSGIEIVSSMGQVDTSGGWVLSLTDAELNAPHPLLLQYDSRWATYPYGTGTMQSSACGPTCFSMVITALTNISNASPPYIATYSMNHNYYVTGVGTAHALFTEGCTEFGLYCNEIPNNEAMMKSHIDNNEILILSVHYGNFTHSGSGHFITIYGYDDNGFMVNDPGSYDRSCQYWPYSVISGDIERIYALGSLGIY